MNIPIIKFSHRYFKMPPSVENLHTILLSVQITERKQLPPIFLAYDTSYGVDQFYKLPDGRVLVLYLFSFNENSSGIWTTVRRWTPQKETYYQNIIGKEVVIEVNDTPTGG